MSEENSNPNLKHNKALYEKRLMFGVPSKLFVVAIAIVIAALISAGWMAAIVFFLVLIPPLVIAHKDDENAIAFLFDKLKRPDFYSAGGVDEKTLKVIKKIKNKYVIKNIKDLT